MQAFRSKLVKYNLKGFIVANGATNWDLDISPAFPDVVYNFHLIPEIKLKTFNANNCVFYFNDVKAHSQ